ncbi:MAG: hypothetical protein N2554_09930 [Fimbriimonadales bacterium]|nr:hypothetical protein [Fimbriimonadales bacterium]
MSLIYIIEAIIRRPIVHFWGYKMVVSLFGEASVRWFFLVRSLVMLLVGSALLLWSHQLP